MNCCNNESVFASCEWQMDLRDVQSSVLSAVGYDEERHLLEVKFRTGRVYHYHQVPPELFAKLLAARSAGQYFNRAIRSRFRAELIYDPQRPVR